MLLSLKPALQFEDLVGLPFLADGRSRSGFDCIGLALELYRRSGLELPDPHVHGVEALRKLLEPIEWPEQPLDLIHVRSRARERVLCVVGAGFALGARERDGVFRYSLSTLRRVTARYPTAFWRLRG